ncbi:MAG: hypothetical protein ACLS9T_09760 [Streptococcus salivarius]
MVRQHQELTGWDNADSPYLYYGGAGIKTSLMVTWYLLLKVQMHEWCTKQFIGSQSTLTCGLPKNLPD